MKGRSGVEGGEKGWKWERGREKKEGVEKERRKRGGTRNKIKHHLKAQQLYLPYQPLTWDVQGTCRQRFWATQDVQNGSWRGGQL